MLLEEIISKSNIHLAYERLIGNKGAAGVDGMGMLDFVSEVRLNWPLIKSQLEKGEYRPPAVKRVKIPKANGGTRSLGIPTLYGQNDPAGYLPGIGWNLRIGILGKQLWLSSRKECSSGFRKGKRVHQ